MAKKRKKNNINFFLEVIICTVVATLSALIIFNSINIKAKEVETVFSYNQKTNLDYVVNYKDTELYPTSLPSGGTYVTGLIDNINISYGYNLSSTKLLDYKYDYRVIATIRAEYQNENIWNSDPFELMSETIDGSNNVSINDSVIVDMDKYMQELIKCRDTVGLDVTGYLDVYVYINVSGEDSTLGIDINESPVLETTIPLSKEVVSITTNVPSLGTKNMTNVIEHGMITNIFFFILGSALLCGSLTIGITTLIKYFDSCKEKSVYLNTLNKYLKDYGDIIVEADKIPDIKKLNVIDVKSFEELLDAQDELRIPIIFAEKKAREGWFLLINNNQVYKYVLSSKK